MIHLQQLLPNTMIIITFMYDEISLGLHRNLVSHLCTYRVLNNNM